MPQLLFGLDVAIFGEQCPRKAEPPERPLPASRRRPPKTPDRLCAMTEGIDQCPRTIPGLRHRRQQLGCAIIGGDGGLRLARLLQRNAEPEERVAVTRISGNRRPQGGDRIGQQSGFEAGKPEIMLDDRIRRLHRSRLPQGNDRVGGASGAQKLPCAYQIRCCASHSMKFLPR